MNNFDGGHRQLWEGKDIEDKSKTLRWIDPDLDGSSSLTSSARDMPRVASRGCHDFSTRTMLPHAEAYT